jgi:hypothetical protein
MSLLSYNVAEHGQMLHFFFVFQFAERGVVIEEGVAKIVCPFWLPPSLHCAKKSSSALPAGSIAIW